MRNEHRLERIIQQQRLQMFFRQCQWLETLKENARLRGIVCALETQLEEAGIPYQIPIAPDEQLLLPFVNDPGMDIRYDSDSTKTATR